MANWNLLINAIDLNHNGKVDSKREIQKAKTLGIEAKEGQYVKEIINKTPENKLQEALEKIDNSQKVDNKNLFETSALMNKEHQNNIQTDDSVKRKRFSALA